MDKPLNIPENDEICALLHCPKCNTFVNHRIIFKKYAFDNQVVNYETDCLGCAQRARDTTEGGEFKRPAPQPQVLTAEHFVHLWVHRELPSKNGQHKRVS